MNKHRTQGFTLVEIMVAMVISLVILGGAISVLVQNQRNYRENDDFGRLQENARFALDLISTDLRMAGFMGCARNNTQDDRDTARDGKGGNAKALKIYSNLTGIEAGSLLDLGSLTDKSNYLDGWEDSAPGTWGASNAADPDPASIDGFILKGTDAILIRRLRNRGVPITKDMKELDDPIEVTAVPVNAGEIAAIYDCEGTDIFQVTDSTANTIQHKDGNPGNLTASLRRTYLQNSSYLKNPDALGNQAKTFVAAVDATRYYISNETERPSLWRQYYTGAGIDKQELVEGIENMQILYGVDATDPLETFDGVPDDYRTADKVEKWNYVVAVRITMLIATVDEYGADKDDKMYDINGTPDNAGDDWQAPGDRRMRKLVTSTVLLRNMQARLASEGDAPVVKE
ncbi:MAG TPA: PilW family protein [Gammaproteobacteria bacterium]|nr:PilW family protein [Gammaproteobacteria bacterium]